MQKWLKAFRLRTLPLSFASIIMGASLAIISNDFDTLIFVLCLTTTLFLQILSNLANDFGDADHDIGMSLDNFLKCQFGDQDQGCFFGRFNVLVALLATEQ